MRIFKNTWFNRFADKEGITDEELMEAAAQLEAGLPDADLGGGVYKVRAARSGGGKSGVRKYWDCIPPIAIVSGSIVIGPGVNNFIGYYKHN